MGLTYALLRWDGRAADDNPPKRVLRVALNLLAYEQKIASSVHSPSSPLSAMLYHANRAKHAAVASISFITK